MTPEKLVANFTYTNQELLDLWRECFARITIQGQSYQMVIPGGGTRTFTNANVAEVSSIVMQYQRIVDAESGASRGGTQNLVRFQRAR